MHSAQAPQPRSQPTLSVFAPLVATMRAREQGAAETKSLPASKRPKSSNDKMDVGKRLRRRLPSESSSSSHNSEEEAGTTSRSGSLSTSSTSTS